MARPKKTDDKVKEASTLSINVDDFVRTRDSVVTGLAMLQDAIQTLSSTYIQHTNSFLGEQAAGHDVASVLSRLGDNPLVGSLQNLARAASVPPPAGEPAGSDKKERKKRMHDPNAPKRPLTPFFLYMQTARPIISNDLGAEVPKGAVSQEGTRRWGTMALDDKQLWSNAYRENLRLYNARMHSYKTGKNPDAKDMTDQEALQYAEDNNLDATADAQLVGEANAGALLDDDAEGEPDKEPTPPPKATPKPKAARKTKVKTPVAAPETIVPPTPIVPARELEKSKSPEKKRKRASKKGDEIPQSDEPVAAVETPKSSGKPRKKKTKADA